MSRQIETGARIEQSSQFDIPTVVKSAQDGNVEALERLYVHMSRRLNSFFASRIPAEAEDLAQDTTVVILSELQKFDPQHGRGNFIQNFYAWSRTIARHRLFHHSVQTQRTSELSGNEVYVHEGSDNQDLEPQAQGQSLKDKLIEVLQPRQLHVVSLSLDGMTSAEIAAKLGGTESAIKNVLMRARRRIEKRLIYPAGFRKLADIDSSLRVPYDAIYTDQFPAVHLLGRWYVSEGDIKRYQPRSRWVDQSLLDKGYVLLIEHTTYSEYHTVLNNPRYASAVIRSGNRLFIKPDDLTLIRQTAEKQPNRRVASPSGEYFRLSHFANSAEEYNRLHRAIRTGKLEVARKDGFIFATQEAVDAFFATQSHPQ